MRVPCIRLLKNDSRDYYLLGLLLPFGVSAALFLKQLRYGVVEFRLGFSECSQFLCKIDHDQSNGRRKF